MVDSLNEPGTEIEELTKENYQQVIREDIDPMRARGDLLLLQMEVSSDDYSETDPKKVPA